MCCVHAIDHLFYSGTAVGMLDGVQKMASGCTGSVMGAIIDVCDVYMYMYVYVYVDVYEYVHVFCYVAFDCKKS